jgi:phosphatidylserine/phosphatidylglycerophosphate/cardiolipin synthase-like enzyme
MPGPLKFPKLPPLPQVTLPKIAVATPVLPQPIRQAIDGFVAGVRSVVQPHQPTPTVLPGSAGAKALNAALSYHYPSGADAAAVVRLLEGKTPSELRELRSAYRAEFGTDLDGAVNTRLGGASRDQARALLRGTSPMASPLGNAVTASAWAANHANGTVPTSDLYSTRNAFDGAYVNAREIFPAMADSIAGAKHEVNIEFFDWIASQYDKSGPWQNDPTMVLADGIGRLQERLKAEQAQGLAPKVPVKVYIAVDGANEDHGGLKEARDVTRQMANLGLDPSIVEVHVGAHEWKGWGAAHTKAVVVDGYKAIVTGANPQSVQTLNASWHDTGYGVRGEAGIAIRKDFDDRWKDCKEIVSMDLTKLEGTPVVTTRATTAINHAPEVLAPDLDADPALRGAELPMFVATHRGYHVAQGLPDGDSAQDQAWLSMLANAKDVVKIESPNLNDRMAKQAIIDAVNRGTKVELVLSFGFNSASERQTRAGQNAGGSNEDTVQDLYARITDPEARKRLHVKWYSWEGNSPNLGNWQGASHTKFMSADGAVALVGSGNQDRASWNIVRETNVVIDGRDAVAVCDGRVFDPDFQKGIDAIEWARAIREGRVATTPVIDGFLNGDAKAWSAALLASYERP